MVPVAHVAGTVSAGRVVDRHPAIFHQCFEGVSQMLIYYLVWEVSEAEITRTFFIY